MNTKRNILIAFLLNLIFSVFEFFGGIISGSSAILSDAVHDLGDALSIGVSFFLERKNKREADEKYTFGYTRYSILGSIITTLVLLIGSCLVVFGAVRRLIHPTVINYNEMILFAVIGVVVNLSAALITRKGNSLNQKAVNLHMLEDVLGWIVVLIGAIIMKFTDYIIIDSIMSLGIAIYIMVNSFKTLYEILEIFLEKTPHNIDINNIKNTLLCIDEVIDVHHIHIWSIDGQYNCATMHIIAKSVTKELKNEIRSKLNEQGISHTTLEFESEFEKCECKTCRTEVAKVHRHHHHH